MNKSFRFETYINGGAKVTLRPGQSLTWSQGGDTDEGYEWEAVTWTHVGDGVHRHCASGGRDCDGASQSDHEDFCPAAKLWTGANWYGEPMPDWEEGQAEVFDQYAQAAGY